MNTVTLTGMFVSFSQAKFFLTLPEGKKGLEKDQRNCRTTKLECPFWRGTGLLKCNWSTESYFILKIAAVMHKRELTFEFLSWTRD